MEFKKIFLEFWHTAQEGYNQTSWFFLILTGGVVLDKFVGVSGLLGAGIVTGIFYEVGAIHNHINKKGAKKNARK